MDGMGWDGMKGWAMKVYDAELRAVSPGGRVCVNAPAASERADSARDFLPSQRLGRPLVLGRQRPPH